MSYNSLVKIWNGGMQGLLVDWRHAVVAGLMQR